MSNPFSGITAAHSPFQAFREEVAADNLLISPKMVSDARLAELADQLRLDGVACDYDKEGGYIIFTNRVLSRLVEVYVSCNCNLVQLREELNKYIK